MGMVGGFDIPSGVRLGFVGKPRLLLIQQRNFRDFLGKCELGTNLNCTKFQLMTRFYKLTIQRNFVVTYKANFED